MNRNLSPVRILIACLVCVLLEYIPYRGVLAPVESVQWCLVLVSACVVYLGLGPALFAAMICGFLLDSGAARPVFMIGFTLFAVSGKALSRNFYTPRSVFHILAQVVLFAIFHGLFLGAALYPDLVAGFRAEVWASALAPNAALDAGVLALWPARSRSFSVYRL